MLKKLEERVNRELEQWPEHAVLNDVRFFFKNVIR
jgi:hypothetical protein